MSDILILKSKNLGEAYACWEAYACSKPEYIGKFPNMKKGTIIKVIKPEDILRTLTSSSMPSSPPIGLVSRIVTESTAMVMFYGVEGERHTTYTKCVEEVTDKYTRFQYYMNGPFIDE